MVYSIDGFNNIRQAILDKITADETSIQEAYFELRSEFGGSPAAVIDISNNEALYHSNQNDRLTFVFQIRIYIPIKDDTDAHTVEVNMGKAYWEVLNMFANRRSLEGFVDFTEPIPSTWGYMETDAGVFRYSEINLRCVLFSSNR